MREVKRDAVVVRQVEQWQCGWEVIATGAEPMQPQHGGAGWALGRDDDRRGIELQSHGVSERPEIGRLFVLQTQGFGNEVAKILRATFEDPLVIETALEMKAARASGDPELAHRGLATENDLVAVVAAQGQNPAAVAVVEVAANVVERSFDRIKGVIDGLIKAGFAECVWGMALGHAASAKD
jgi:hypothetical protein